MRTIVLTQQRGQNVCRNITNERMFESRVVYELAVEDEVAGAITEDQCHKDCLIQCLRRC